MAHCNVNQRRKLPLHALKRRNQQFTTGNDDDIDFPWRDGQSEDFAHPSLREIAIDSSAKLLTRRDTDSRVPLGSRQHEHGHEPAVLLGALVEDP